MTRDVIVLVFGLAARVTTDNVLEQSILPRKGLLAQSTQVRTAIAVDLGVRVQQDPRDELLVAQATGERFLFGMGYHVLLQKVERAESLLAQAASVYLFPWQLIHVLW